MPQQLLEKLNHIRLLKSDFREDLREALQESPMQRHQVWLGQGQVSRGILFIKRGAAMAYRSHHGKQCITMLWQTDDFIIPGNSLFMGRSSMHSIKMLEDSLVLHLSFSALSRLRAKHKQARYITTYFLSEALGKVEDLSFRLAHDYPQELYDYLSHEYAHPFSLLTQDQRASFMGKSRQTLYSLHT